MSVPEGAVLRQDLTLAPKIPIVPDGRTLALDAAWNARQDARDEEEWGKLLAEGAAMAPEPGAPEKPSAVAKGAEAGLEAAGQGAQSFMTGLTGLLLRADIPPEAEGKGTVTEVAGGLAGKAKAAGDMAMGLMGILSSPGAALGAGVEQTLKNISPDKAKLPIPGFGSGPGSMSSLFRTMVGGDPADQSPMTIGEAANLVTMQATPFVAGRVKKGLPAGVKALGEQRGSMGVAGDGPSVGAQAAANASRLNTERVGAPARVKKLMRDINAGATPWLAEHRAVQSHGQTIAESRGVFATLEEAVNAPASDLVADKAKALSFRDHYNAVAKHTEGLARRAAKGDAEAIAAYSDAEALLIDMSIKDEVAGATLGRGLEARKILSDASRADVGVLDERRLQVAETLREERAVARRLETDIKTAQRKAGLPALERALERTRERLEGLKAKAAEADVAKDRADHIRELIAAEEDTAREITQQITIAREKSAGIPALERSLAKKRETIEELVAKFAEARAALDYAKSLREAGQFSIEKIQELREKLDGLAPEVRAARMLELTAPERKSYALTLGQYAWVGVKGFMDIMHWAFIQNLLSGPHTHAANVLGTGSMALYHIPERYAAGVINSVFFRNPQGVQRAEAWAAAKGLVEGSYTDSVRMMGRALKGEQVFGVGPVESHFDIRARTFGLDPENMPGKAVEIAGMLQPTRLMGVEDAYFKGANYRAELKALAVREAMSEKLRGAALDERIAFYEDNPTPQMIVAAREAALLRTFNAELGPVGRALQMAIMATPAKWVVPFFRTPTNIGKAVWQRAPVLNLLSQQNWQDIAAGGAKRDMALSRMALGSAVGCAVAWQVLQGNCTGRGVLWGPRDQEARGETTVAGAGPSNKNLARDQREDGLPQFAIRPPGGDEWFHYSRIDPFGMYVGTISTAIEVMSQVPDPEEHWVNVVAAAGLAAGHAMLSKTRATGASTFLDALLKPDRNAKKVAMGFARSIVPAGVRQVTRSGFPGVVEPHPEMRELRDFTDAILSGLPDLSPVGLGWLPSVLDVAPKLHPITGDPMIYPAGWGPDLISPIYVTTRKNDPVLDEIISNEISVNVMPRVVSGTTPQAMGLTAPSTREGVSLTKEEYYRVQVLATKGGEADEQGGVTLGPLAGLPTLYDRLLALITSDAYTEKMTPGPDGSQADAILSVINLYREAARGQLQRESPALAEAIRARQEIRLRQKVTPDRQPPATTPAGAQYLEQLSGTLRR